MNIRVLIVDDDDDVVASAKRFQPSSGASYEFVDVDTLEQALQQLDESSFDAVICDNEFMTHPRTGLDLLDWIRSSGNDIPFILLTQKGQDDLAIRALNLGADYFLEKSRSNEETIFVEISQHIEDTVKSRRLQDALSSTETRFRAIFEQSAIGMAQVSLDGRILFPNDALVDLLGFPREELIQMQVAEISHPEDMVKERTLTQELVDGIRTHYQMEKRYYRKDGIMIWGKLTVSLIRNSSGTPQFVYGMIQDITETRYIQSRLSKQHEFLTNVLESLSHPFYVINSSDYTVAMANSAARIGPMTGQETCYSLTHGRDTVCLGKEHPCPLEEVKRTRKPVKVEHEHFNMYGEVGIFEIHAFPIFDEQGEIVQVIEYNLEVTEQRRSEDILKKERDRAEELYQALLSSLTEDIYVFDKKDNFIQYYGSNFVDLYERADEFRGKHVTEIMQSDMLDKYNEIVTIVRQTGDGQSIEYTREHKGRKQWYCAAAFLHGDKKSIIFTLKKIIKS